MAIVLHPCFLFFYCFLFVNFTITYPLPKIYFYKNIIIVFLLTVCLPSLFPIIYARDAFLKERKFRPLSLLVTLVSYCICYIWLYPGFFMYAGPILSQQLNLLKILIVGLLCLLVVSFWFKISLHANGIGFLLALTFIPGLHSFLDHNFLSANSFIIIGVVLIIGSSILLWQRVASGAHTFSEVFWGFLCGFGVTLIMELFLR